MFAWPAVLRAAVRRIVRVILLCAIAKSTTQDILRSSHNTPSCDRPRCRAAAHALHYGIFRKSYVFQFSWNLTHKNGHADDSMALELWGYSRDEKCAGRSATGPGRMVLLCLGAYQILHIAVWAGTLAHPEVIYPNAVTSDVGAVLTDWVCQSLLLWP